MDNVLQSVIRLRRHHEREVLRDLAQAEQLRLTTERALEATNRDMEDTLGNVSGDDPADMARRHLRRSPCPVQLQSAARRAAALSQTIRRGRAEGVVLLPYKGCEPHAFDNVILAQSLDQLGVPHITLEIDPHLGGWGQITTRLEAFVEMLDGVGDDELYPDSQAGRP